jgi:beta-N-acetylhexosaminidase
MTVSPSLRFLRAAAALAGASLLASCVGGEVQPIVIDVSRSVAPAETEPPSVRGLTLAEKVGQLFVVDGFGVFQNDASPAFLALKRQVEQNYVGGIVWRRSNVYETAFLNEKLQAAAKVPLLVAADLEAGAGMRFQDVTYGPWAMAVAATGDVALAEKYAHATGVEARALGISQIYAPVADVNVNPDNPVINVRSFGEDPQEVARFVAATVKGIQSAKVAATLKHFPGHGDTAVDSHRALAVVAADRARLDAVELVPFRAGIAAGAKAVMVAHLAVPAIDPTPAPPLREAPADAEYKVTAGEISKEATTPATLSAPIVTELLRKQLGFRGLVLTDAMGMNGISLHLPPGEAAVRAILAGVDVVLMSPDTDAALQAVIEAVKSGRISHERLNESVDRILTLKKALNLFEEKSPDLTKIGKVVDSPQNRALEAEVARRSLTLVREEAGTLPLRKDAKLLSLVVSDEATLNGPAAVLTAEMKKRDPATQTARLDPRSTAEEVAAAVAAAAESDAVLVSLFVRTRSGQGPISVPEPGKAAVTGILALGKPVAAVSFGNPYLLRELPSLPTYVCAWGAQDVMQTAAAAALFGETAFEGKLPITIPGLAKRGDGIFRAGEKLP